MPSQFCHKIFGVLGVKRDHEKVDDRLLSFETHNLHCQPLEGSRTPFRFLWPAILHTNGTFTPSLTLCAQADFGHYPFLKGTGGRSEYNFDKKTWKAKRSGVVVTMSLLQAVVCLFAFP